MGNGRFKRDDSLDRLHNRDKGRTIDVNEADRLDQKELANRFVSLRAEQHEVKRSNWHHRQSSAHKSLDEAIRTGYVF